jgi:hypothetical protein
MNAFTSALTTEASGNLEGTRSRPKVTRFRVGQRYSDIDHGVLAVTTEASLSEQAGNGHMAIASSREGPCLRMLPLKLLLEMPLPHLVAREHQIIIPEFGHLPS